MRRWWNPQSRVAPLRFVSPPCAHGTRWWASHHAAATDRLGALFSTELPPAPDGAWEFATLGVRPTARGAGLGAALIDAMLALIDSRDSESIVALETSDLRNVRLYERHGFVVTATTAIEDGPTVYSMRRG